jgi:hypothetical protein
MLLADYPLLDIVWTMFIFFLFFIWLMILFRIFGDIFRRRDIGGGAKALWIIFVILLPFLGVFIYLISQNDGMTQRALDVPRRSGLRRMPMSSQSQVALLERSSERRACSIRVRSHKPSSTRSSRRHSRRRRQRTVAIVPAFAVGAVLTMLANTMMSEALHHGCKFEAS